MIRLRRRSGQGLVEVAVVLPLLLLLFVGSYVCCRSTFLISAAETAARDETLRMGRSLPGNKEKKSDSIIAGGKGVIIRAEGNGNSRLLPAPFPSLAGRTRGIVEIHKEWEEAGGFEDLPRLHAVRAVEASVDCWDRKSLSGKKVSGFVNGCVAMGFLR